ncbi:MAG: host attachment protein [Bdellovibrio sp.]|nr:host attachment protein [Bdellovibrio sp.]
MKIAKERIWVMIGNIAQVRIYESPDIRLDKLVLVHQFINTEARLRSDKLRDFNIGRVHSKNYPRTKGLRPKETPHESVRLTFAKTLADYIEKARKHDNFEKLMIVAAPRFLGAIRQFLSKETKAMLWNEIPKELNFENKRDIISYLHRSA